MHASGRKNRRKVEIVRQGISNVRSVFNSRTQVFLLAAAALLVASAVPVALAAQKPPTTDQENALRPHRRAANTSPKTPQPAAAPAEQLAPKPPDWPANDKPGDANVSWNSKGLRIEAANSSLQQILKDVATATGAKVTGLSADQRIFGTYGPGQARDVISQLLDGSGYNILMIGDRGQGTPREIVLSKQSTGPAPGSANNSNSGNDDSSNADVEEPPPPPPPMPPQQQQPPPMPQQNPPNGFSPGMQPRTPQQILQEMQQRQQQIEQQQQQQRTNPQ
jgi:hypothetical protein